MTWIHHDISIRLDDLPQEKRERFMLMVKDLGAPYEVFISIGGIKNYIAVRMNEKKWLRGWRDRK